jgi:hypothetical protein
MFVVVVKSGEEVIETITNEPRGEARGDRVTGRRRGLLRVE